MSNPVAPHVPKHDHPADSQTVGTGPTDPDAPNPFGPDAPNVRDDDPPEWQQVPEADPPKPPKTVLEAGDFAPDEG
jgi:hypothetical protein